MSIRREDIGKTVVVDAHGPYAGEVGELTDFDPGLSWRQGYIKFEDGSGTWLLATRLSVKAAAKRRTRRK